MHYYPRQLFDAGSTGRDNGAASPDLGRTYHYYVRIHSTLGRHLIRASLTSLESRLDPRMFVRVHRTAIVNVEHVRESHVRDGLCLVLSDAAQVGVSRGRKSHVESLLSPRLR